MTVRGLPNPQWKAVDEENRLTQAWYQYLKEADEAWRPRATILTSLSTVNNPNAHIVPNHGMTLFNITPGTTEWILEAPEPGCRAVIAMASSSTSLVVSLQSTSHFIRNPTAATTGWKLAFSSSGPFKLVELVGLSTARYYIVSNPGTGVTVTT